MRRRFPLLFAAAVLAGLAVAHETRGGHDRAREAVERGEILPLEDILKRVRADFAGEMLAVELEEERHDRFDAGLVYEVKLLADDGAVTELYYDARTGELLKARGHGLEEHDRDDRGHDDRERRDRDYDDRDYDDHERDEDEDEDHERDEDEDDEDGWGWFDN
jgi:hypothetical protein